MKREKQLLLDEIKEQLTNSSSFVIAQYEKLSADKANDFRKVVSKIGGNFEVVRKRVLLKALQEVGVNIELAAMPGHIGIVFVQADPIEVAKAILKYSEDNNKVFALRGATVDGQLFNGEEAEELSKLPGKDQMRAEFLGLLEAPMAQTLSVVEAALSSVVYCLENKASE